MIINETPRRTSRNYNINEYVIDEIKIDNIVTFNNYNTNINLKDINEDISIKYGVFNKYDNFNFSKELIIDKDSYLEFNLDNKNNKLLDYLKIVVEDNKNANVVIRYNSKKNSEYYHSGLIKTIIGNNSKVKIVLLNLINDKSINLISMDNIINSNSSLEYSIVDFGGLKSISNYYSNMLGDNSKNSLNSIYLGYGKKDIDINYIIEIYGKNNEAYIDCEGALNDYSKKNFKGTIDFKKGSSKSIGEESEYATILSKNARSKSLPMLLCSEEDVKGAHSSASGKIDNKELFYILSRGISEIDAIKLLVKSRFNKTLNSINNEKLREEIESIIDSKIK